MIAFLRRIPGYPPHVRLHLRTLPANHITISSLKVVMAILFILSIGAGFIGIQDPYHNILPTMTWVAWWVGLTFVCALFGDMWALTNPLNSLYSALEAFAARVNDGRSLSLDLRYPEWLGVWPAFLVFVGFTWVELIWARKDEPAALADIIIIYSSFTWTGMFIWGRERWVQRGEAFTILFGLLGRFAPIDVSMSSDRKTASLYLRPVGAGLRDTREITLSFVIFILATLSAITFDGLLETPLFQKVVTYIYSTPSLAALLYRFSDITTLEENKIISSLVFAAVCIFFIVAFLTTSWLMLVAVKYVNSGDMKDFAGSSSKVACHFILSLVPIAIAYHLAHYLSLLLTQGQFIIPLLSDPLGRGWNLFGTAGYQVDLGLVGPKFIWYASITAILVGHIFSVYLAHMAALETFRNNLCALVSQIPLVILMIGYTMLSLWILAQPIIS
jgi:hypothetical protein